MSESKSLPDRDSPRFDHWQRAMFRVKDWYNGVDFSRQRIPPGPESPLVLTRPPGRLDLFEATVFWVDLADRIVLAVTATKSVGDQDDALATAATDLGWEVGRVVDEPVCTWSFAFVASDTRPITPVIDLCVLILWPFGTPEPNQETSVAEAPPRLPPGVAADDLAGLAAEPSTMASSEREPIDEDVAQTDGTHDPQQFLFEFQVDDDEVTKFRCRAGALDEAMIWVDYAGHRDNAVLLAKTSIDAAEQTATARAAALDDPLLGPGWMPLIDALAGELDSLPVGRPRTVQTYAAKYWLDPHRSPYFQFLRQADGSVLAEISGPPLESLAAPEWDDRLRLLGWRLKDDIASFTTSPMLQEQLGSPNPTKRFPAAKSAYSMIRNVLSMVIFSWEIDQQDLFALVGYPEVFDRQPGLRRVDNKPIFSIELERDPSPTGND